MKPIKSLNEELLELMEVAEKEGHFSWEAFEGTDDGHLTFKGFGEEPYTYDFYMRVGTHMGQPRQAILSCGKFMKMRKAEKKEHWHLKQINPHKVSDSLYVVSQPYGSPTVGGLLQVGGPPYAGAFTGFGGGFVGGFGQASAVPMVSTHYTWNPDKAFPDYALLQAQANAQYAQQYNQYSQINVNITNVPTLARWGGLQSGLTGQPYTLTNAGAATMAPVYQTTTQTYQPGILSTLGNMLGVTTKI